MATRLEKVVLDLDDRFSAGIIKDAAAVAALRRELDSLSGTAVRTSRTTKDFDKSLASTGSSASRAAGGINQLTGRLRLFAGIAATLGPALIPIGAVAIPALTGLTAQFGFAAVGAGTAMIAFQGVGTALDAMRKANLDPTVENLAAAKLAMEQIGPPAQEFVNQLMEMGPAFRSLRDAAAAGLFPGLVESLDHMEGVLPRVASLFEAVGSAVGDLAASGAESLAGPRWAEFISFIEAEAPRALTELGQTLGSVAHGLAELWMAFTPLNNDFSGWLKDAAASFDDWAAGLSQTDGFRDFVDYVRESGPKVADAAAAIGNALVQIVTAAAPLGGHVLSAVTAFANALATLANSPVGDSLLATLTAMSALKFGAKALDGLTGLMAGLDAVGPKAAKANLAMASLGKGLVFVGVLESLDLMESKLDKIFDTSFAESDLTRNLEALADGRAADNLDKIGGYVANLNAAFLQGTDKAVGWLPGDTDVAKAREEIEKIDQALAGMVESGNADTAAAAFAEITKQARDEGVAMDEITGSFEAYNTAVANAGIVTGETSTLFSRFAGMVPDVGAIADGFDNATVAALAFEDALAGLTGWLDRREALRGYADSLAALGKSLKNGFTRKDAENLDAIGRSIEQTFSAITNPTARENFIDKTIADLNKLATGAGPKARAQIEDLIRHLQKLDKSNVDPKIDINDLPAKKKAAAVNKMLRQIDGAGAEPVVDAKVDAAMAKLGMVRAEIAGIPQYIPVNVAVTVNRSINTISDAANSVLDTVIPNRADGGTVPKTGRPYADRHLYMLADGEEVISNRRGQADRHRGLLKAINAGRAADGATVGTHASTSNMGGGLYGATMHAMNGLTALGDMTLEELKARRQELRVDLKFAEKKRDSLKKDLDAARETRDGIRSAWESLAGGLGSKGGTDLFGEGATFESFMAGANANFDTAAGLQDAIQRLSAAGFSPTALNALLEQADLETIIRFSNYTRGQLSQVGAGYSLATGAQIRAGNAGGSAVFGAQLSSANAEVAQSAAELREANKIHRRTEKQLETVTKELEQVKDHLKEIKDKSPKKTGDAVGAAISRGGGSATRRNR